MAEMSEAQKEEYIKIVQGLDRKELIRLLAGVQFFPDDVLAAIREQLNKHAIGGGAWY